VHKTTENKKILTCLRIVYSVKKIRDSWICFDQTFLRRGMGILFSARESLVSDIPAGEGNPLNLSLQCITRKELGIALISYIFVCNFLLRYGVPE
jgi:hypothetical protein